MNIFWLDEDARKCAEYHNNSHCVKQILEYAQLLSTAHRILDGIPSVSQNPKTKRKTKQFSLTDPRMDSVLYKATHINHPCAIWVRESKENYYATYHLFTELLYEYNVRYGRKHKTSALSFALSRAPLNLSKHGSTPKPLCMPDHYKVNNDVVESYRNYYRDGKSHLAKWKFRSEPAWYKKDE